MLCIILIIDLNPRAKKLIFHTPVLANKMELFWYIVRLDSRISADILECFVT